MLKRWIHGKREEGTFAADRNRHARTHRRTVFLLIGATAALGWLYVLFGSDMFRITRIEIDGIRDLKRGDVEAQTYESMDAQGRWFWGKRNSLLLNEKNLSRDLESKLYAEDVAVEKSYPNILRLKIQERQSSVIIISDNAFYLVDRNGIGTEHISSEDEERILARISQPSPTPQKEIPILTINRNVSFAQGAAFVEPETAKRWLDAFYDLSESGFGYRNAILDHPTSTKLTLNMFEPYDVYFDLLAPLRPQIQSYYTFMKVKSADAKISSYIDVRVPSKIFYK